MSTLTLPSLVEPETRSKESTRPVRVCFLIDELATAGTEMQLLALLRRLDRRRVVPALCLLRGEGSTSRALEPTECPVYRLGVGRLRSPVTGLQVWSFARWLRTQRIDVVQTYFPDSSYFGITAAWLAGVPHRVRTRNNLGHWLTTSHRFLGRLLNLLTTRTIANCAAARARLLTDERPRPQSVRVLENGVDLERFVGIPMVRGRSPSGPARVGVVANLRSVKGLDVLVRAATRLSAEFPRATFVVAGEGEERRALTEQIRVADLSKRFHLVGSVADVPGFLADLDVTVLPSRAEGMSNAVLEYMAAGRPVVATAVGANPEVLEHGVTGLLVPPGDDAALAWSLGKLLREPATARRMGEAARVVARQRFSREAMVERFEDFYQGLVMSAEQRIS
jgi:glycosyltransferase involved in cell wall biosynthesis